MSKIRNLIGQKFGKLTVIKLSEERSKNRHVQWICICDCDPNKEVVVSSDKLINGITKSCHCYIKESNIKNGLKRRKQNKYNLENNFGIGYTENNEEFYFDLEDYDKIKDYCWFLKEGYLAYSDNINKLTIRMHRLILNFPEKEIDHINRNRNDNRKTNLRIVSDLENSHNRSKNKDNASGIIGVRYYKPNNKWLVKLTNNHNEMFFGYFDDFELAIIARLQAELKYFGPEFAPQRHLFEQYGII